MLETIIPRIGRIYTYSVAGGILRRLFRLQNSSSRNETFGSQYSTLTFGILVNGFRQFHAERRNRMLKKMIVLLFLVIQVAAVANINPSWAPPPRCSQCGGTK
jgi:hypothetical protein